jgi:acyl dehydratase
VQTIEGISGVEDLIGTHLGFSEWHRIDQRQIDLFAAATGDHQWIHTDPARAADGPFGATIAHGYLTLSLVPKLVWEVYNVTGLAMAVNYGTNVVRFPAPVTVDSRIRAGVDLVSLQARPGGAQLTSRVTVELEAAAKPACVVETVTLLVP